MDLFSTEGYETTTVDDIVARAGVAQRTFFRHFATKDDILFAGYVERLDEATRRFRASRATSLWAALAESSDAVAAAIDERPDVFLARARLYHDVPSLRATMLRINEEWIDQIADEVARWLGVDARTDLRPRLAATVVNGANRTAIATWVTTGGHDDLAVIMSGAMDLLRPTITRIEQSTTEQRHVDVV